MSGRTDKSITGEEGGWLNGWLVPAVVWLAGGGRSQFGVVLQDDLQLLTQHDVPSDLQLAGEESLQTIFMIGMLIQHNCRELFIRGGDAQRSSAKNQLCEGGLHHSNWCLSLQPEVTERGMSWGALGTALTTLSAPDVPWPQINTQRSRKQEFCTSPWRRWWYGHNKQHRLISWVLSKHHPAACDPSSWQDEISHSLKKKKMFQEESALYHNAQAGQPGSAARRRFLYLLRVELPLHHLHEVFIRHREGHVGLPPGRALLQRAAVVLQVDGCAEAEELVRLDGDSSAPAVLQLDLKEREADVRRRTLKWAKIRLIKQNRDCQNQCWFCLFNHI